ncbi:putative antirepressor protein [Enterobacter hormaechei]|uniref:BRO-N domain-containing protein n=1 Tax=Enterobacter hormaechei TaxID=158836 RepID=UPI000799AA53|nr:BRO family protein [Enterobacter hormaechei]SAA29944.1 putative antirepressor protein [Enterobacter hormaechei]SAB04484.1 putative antirepressor protein [Enterobacter hormaechei]VAG26687.1 putative antirepressor protein [Enterobacter hormaechei]VAG86573.1 putative antirepressor protein [Enterobacter hormaechei]VAG92900.1 putative antirepressor protein [Enterobacter hormaechei]
MNTKPSIFSFESSCNIRAVMVDGNPWFVAADVCSAVGIKHSASAMRALDNDEKGVHSMHTPGGQQDFTIINESGLYTLILRCRDAVTPGTIPYRFRKWVTGEVLPQIRQAGRYVREELSPSDKAQKVMASFMPAILEAMKSGEKQEYNVPLKPGYREHIHSPEGVLGLAEHSLLMNLLNRMQDDGHDVSGAAAEFTTMVSYIVGVSKCLNDIRTHAQYITKNTAGF